MSVEKRFQQILAPEDRKAPVVKAEESRVSTLSTPWKVDVKRMLDTNAFDAATVRRKYDGLLEAMDTPEDFREASERIQGRTDLGGALTEILKSYLHEQIDWDEDEEDED